MSMSFPNNEETSIHNLLCACADHGNFLSLKCRFITLIILISHGVNGSANCGWCRYWACVPSPWWNCNDDKTVIRATCNVSRNRKSLGKNQDISLISHVH